MLQNGKLCFYQWLLMFVLSWHNFDVSVGHPVNAHVSPDGRDMDKCVTHSRALLWNTTEALGHDNHFGGLNCKEQKADLNTKTLTVSACEPNPRQDASCRGQRNTSFDNMECLKNIEQDMQYYRSALLKYSDRAERAFSSRLVQNIDDLTEHCFLSSTPRDASNSEISPVAGNSFERRLKLCKAMKGLQIRAVTINRAISYIASGDYKK